VIAGKSVGVVNICSQEPNRFDREELKLLEELKDDVTYAVVSIRTEMDRKRAEEALRESEEKFEAIYQNSNDAIMLLNKNGFIDCNLQTLKMFKIKEKEEFIKFRPDEVSPHVQPDGKNSFEAVQENISIAYRDGYNHFDWFHRRFDGEDFYADVLLTSFNIGGEQVLQATVRDVTERKQAEETMERYKLLSQNARDIILFIRLSDGQIVEANDAAVQAYGYDREEFTTKSIRDLRATETLNDVEEQLQESNIKSIYFETIHRRRDGTKFPVEVGSREMTINKERILMSIIRDITERKKMEEGLRQMQKLEGLGTLAGGIAHDFNNILGIILAYNSNIKKFKDDSKKLDLATETITKAVDRGKTLVQQILMFARKTETSFGAVNVNDVIMEIVIMIYEMFPKNVTCSQNFDKSIHYINADRSQLHQVLMNLCVNARDAMPKGGVLSISTHMESIARLRNQHPGASESSYVCIEVSDTGEGMTSETQKRIFEPFFTTKGIGKGTGLGLSVTFGVMQTHKGFIDVESELGKGTTFRLYFPVSKIQKVIKVKDEKTLEEIPGGTETLLVVEDEEMLMMSLQMILVEKGYKVIPAKDGLEAVNIYKKRKNEISLVMTDLGLPKLSGIEECAQIKKYNPNARLILATGFLDPVMKSEFLKAGIQHFLYKPYDLKKVLKEIREVLDEK
jgi:PAS domain S-box-containing protein